MKSKKIKQQEWSEMMNEKHRQKVRRRFMVPMLLFLFSLVTVMYATGDATSNDWLKVNSVVSTATIMGLVGNVDKVPNAKRVGKQVKYKLWILSADQFDDTKTFPARSGRERGNIPLKNGEYWHYLEAIDNSLEPKWTGAEGDNAATLSNEIAFVLGGMTDAAFNFLETGIQEKFYVVWEVCSTGAKYIGGNGCKPMILTNFEGGALKDYTGTTVTFKNESGELFSTYVGNTPTQAPDTVAADATTITLTDNPEYKLQDGTSSAATLTSFTAVTDADVGRVLTLMGPDSTPTYPPVITDANDFLLIGGATWTANANAQISFKIFKDGSSTYKFVEISGTRL